MYLFNHGRNRSQRCVKSKRYVDLRKFPPGDLWYVYWLVTLPCTSPLFLEWREVVGVFVSRTVQFEKNYFFLKCGNCIVQIDGSVKDDIA